jgi:hypothetical protein
VDPVRNPYSPGAGRRPAALVGRDHQLGLWSVAIQRAARGRTAQPLVLFGLRGVGKTVLLTEFAREAGGSGWMVAMLEAGAGKTLREGLGEALHAPLADLARPGAGKRLLKALKTALSFKVSYDPTGTWNFGVDLTGTLGGGADSGRLETDLGKLLADLSGAAEEEGIGVAILIDEAQDLTHDEMVAVCAVAHRAGQEGWPLLVAVAGLPDLPRRLADAKSYAERLFSYERIEQLPPELARDALERPAAEEGVEWERRAKDLIVEESGGYPYFLQQFGQDTWNYAHGTTRITLHDAEVGAARGRGHLDNGFFRSRWDRATAAEQAYLRAMARDGDDGSLSGEVAERLSKKITSLGPVRANLIAKGLIYAPEHGRVQFTVPGMADFVQRQAE